MLRDLLTLDAISVLCTVLVLTACVDSTSWDAVIAAEAAAGARTVEVTSSAGASMSAEVLLIASIPPTADVSPRPAARAARGPGGTYIVSGTYRTAAFTVHDSTGELLEIVNREGSGPGEYKYPAWAVTQRDTVFVFDRGNGRVAVLDSSHKHARYFPWPAMIRSLAARDGVFFAHSPPPSGLDGRAFKLFDDQGRIVAEFGESMGALSGARRPVTVGADGDLWAAYYERYVLQQFDKDGKLIRSLYVRRPWFEPWRERRRELSPAVFDITSDSLGRLWVLVAKPVEGWQRPAPRRSTDGFHSAGTDPNDMDAGYDFVVDVIDPAEERMISSFELPNGYFRGFIEPGVLYAFRNDEDWLIHVDIWRIQQASLNWQDSV